MILMLCLNLMLGPTYLPYFFWQQTRTTHIFHLGLYESIVRICEYFENQCSRFYCIVMKLGHTVISECEHFKSKIKV